MRIVVVSHDGSPVDLASLNPLGRLSAARMCRDLLFDLGFADVAAVDRAVEPLPGTSPTVSLSTLAATLHADRRTVKRWLREAGIQGLSLGQGRTSPIYYPRDQVRAWLATFRWHTRQGAAYE